MKLSLLLTLSFCVISSSEAWARTWTVDTGETLEGEYRRVEGESLILLANDVETSYPLARFSEADQEYVKSRQALKPGHLSHETPDTSIRIWSDIAGNQVRGQFVELTEGKVILRDRNGIDSSRQLFELVKADKTYIANLIATRKKSAIAPQVGKLPSSQSSEANPSDSTGAPQSEDTTTPNAPPVAETPALAPGQASYSRRSRKSSSSAPVTPLPAPAAQGESLSMGMILGGLVIGGFLFFFLRRP